MLQLKTFSKMGTGIYRLAPLSPLVPVMLGVEKTDALVGDLKRLRTEFGLKRFVLVGSAAISPCSHFHPKVRCAWTQPHAKAR